LFDGGDRTVAASSARDLAQTLAKDTVGQMTRDMVRRSSAAMAIESLWYLDHGDTARATSASQWLRRHVAGQPRNSVLAVLPAMLMASSRRAPEGAGLRAFVDSVTLDGCCELPEIVIPILARAYESSGDRASALRIVRRGRWYYPPRLLGTQLREEGRLAAALGDRQGAIRAYERYLALRSDPEPQLLPARDSVRAEVDRLRRRP